MTTIIQGLKSTLLVSQGFGGGAVVPTNESIFSGGLGVGQKLVTQGYGSNSSSPTNESIITIGLGVGQRLITQGYFISQSPPPPEVIGGHWPPLNAKGSAYGADWKSKRHRRLLALKKKILPDVPVEEFLRAVNNIEVEGGRDVLELPRKTLRIMILAMMMDD